MDWLRRNLIWIVVAGIAISFANLLNWLMAEASADVRFVVHNVAGILTFAAIAGLIFAPNLSAEKLRSMRKTLVAIGLICCAVFLTFAPDVPCHFEGSGKNSRYICG